MFQPNWLFALATALISCIHFSAGCTNNKWGVNCSQPCGQCSSQALQCDSVTGHCSKGCALWYKGPTCTTYVATCIPHDFTTLEITDTSVKVMWVCEGVTDTTFSTDQSFNYGISHYSRNENVTMKLIYFNSTHQGALFNGAGPPTAFYGENVFVGMIRFQHQHDAYENSGRFASNYITPCAAPDLPSNLTFSEKNRDEIGVQYEFRWQPVTYVRCGTYVYYELIVTLHRQWQNLPHPNYDYEPLFIGTKTFDTFADVILPYNNSYYINVVAVNRKGLVSKFDKFNFTDSIVLQPGSPPQKRLDQINFTDSIVLQPGSPSHEKFDQINFTDSIVLQPGSPSHEKFDQINFTDSIVLQPGSPSHRALAAGLTVGLGVGIPLLIVIIVLAVLLARARRSKSDFHLPTSVQLKFTEKPPAYSRLV